MKHRTIAAAAALSIVFALEAQAAGAHVVQPGESLWSVASANGLSVGTLAAANGLSPTSQLIAGSVINVPATTTTTAQATGQTQTAASGGGRTIQPGESLSSIAAANGVTVSALAAANGLSPTAFLISGHTIRIPAATATTTVSTASANVAPCVSYCSGSNPQPTSERLDAGTIGDIASRYGMSRSLVQAVGWQESGFNNAAVSSANARGVMQIIPPTWDFINGNLAGGTLNPASARDNVAAGALYLRHLYRVKGGDRDATIGSYYQGPNRTTFLPETQRYVTSVLGFKNWFVNNPR